MYIQSVIILYISQNIKNFIIIKRNLRVGVREREHGEGKTGGGWIGVFEHMCP